MKREYRIFFMNLHNPDNITERLNRLSKKGWHVLCRLADNMLLMYKELG